MGKRQEEKVLYIHTIYREDLSDPDWPSTWIEYRVSDSEKEPTFQEALYRGEESSGLDGAYTFIESVGAKAKFLD